MTRIILFLFRITTTTSAGRTSEVSGLCSRGNSITMISVYAHADMQVSTCCFSAMRGPRSERWELLKAESPSSPVGRQGYDPGPPGLNPIPPRAIQFLHDDF